MANYDFLGYGLGLRAEYRHEIINNQPSTIDWFEIATENYLVPGGESLRCLERIRQNYPLVMHGVSMSIGGSDPLDIPYLKQVRQLAHDFDVHWISDHLCWTSHQGKQLHELMPLPYTQEALNHVVTRVCQVQDILGQRILLENVSSYITYHLSEMTEWQFLIEVAKRSDCLLLIDLNNIYVSSHNNDNDPYAYLQAIPKNLVQQLHLAGHQTRDDLLIDTHDEAVIDPVWALYRWTLKHWGYISAMIERDDQLPALSELLEQVDYMRQLAAKQLSSTTESQRSHTMALTE
ncbi:MAG: DUF692 domain-containing protein [Gammaproteobacteria bacterium]